MIEVLLNVRIPELWVTPATEKYDIKIDCRIGGHSDKAGWGIVTMSGDDEILDRVLEEIRGHPSVGSVKVETRKPGTVSFLVEVVKCRPCEVLINSKAFLVFPVYIKGGRMRWLIMTDNNLTLGKICDELEELGCEVKIERVTPLTEKGILTKRQEEVLRTAFALGYFDFPRRTDSKKLARKLGISVSTLSEVMRAAERRVFAEYVHL
ncbi:MAG: hypothetical protein GWO20_12395 [Candidatus Korarchaeota archaeon]|nr:hypothetical protein [Candidatus Korarchaeota archaeon]